MSTIVRTGNPSSGAQVGVFDPIFSGAAFNGTTDDTPAWNAAASAATTNGGGTVIGRPAAVSVIRRLVSNSQQGGGINVGSNTVLDGRGIRLTMRDNCQFIRAAGTVTVTATVTGDTATTDTDITVNSTSGFAVGNDVLLRLGQAPYDTDATEPDFWMYAVVTAVPSGTVLTLDRAIGYSMSVAATTANRRTVERVTLVENVTIKNFDLYNDMAPGSVAEAGVLVVYARNVHLENIVGENTGSGAISIHYAENVTGAHIGIRASAMQNGQASKGRLVSIAECRNVHLTDLWARNFANTVGVVEATCRGIVFDGVTVENTLATRSNSTLPLFASLGKSHLEVRRLKVSGNVAYDVSSGNVRYVDPVFVTDTGLKIGDLTQISNILTIGSTVWSRRRVYRKGFRIFPSTPVRVPLPSGLVTDIRAYVSTTTGITYGYVASTSGTSGPLHSLLVAGSTVPVGGAPSFATAYGPTRLANVSDGGKTFALDTDGTVPAGAYGFVELEMLQQVTTTDDKSFASADVGDTVLLREEDGAMGVLFSHSGVLQYQNPSGAAASLNGSDAIAFSLVFGS